MSANKWDSVVGRDAVSGQMSPTKFAFPRTVYILHVDLDVPDPSTVAALHSALANEASFASTVGNFLAGWQQPSAPGRSLEGLAFLGAKIKAGEIRRSRHWRFAVIPPGVSEGPTAFEIRLVIFVDKVIPEGFFHDTVLAGLHSPRFNVAAFFDAIQILSDHLSEPSLREEYPHAAGLLAAC